jgi:hypothetical protein
MNSSCVVFIKFLQILYGLKFRDEGIIKDFVDITHHPVF